MIEDHTPEIDHAKYNELCALSMSGSLTESEEADLRKHLQTCAECREDHERYVLLTEYGIPLMAHSYAGLETTKPEESVAAAELEQALMARIARSEQAKPSRIFRFQAALVAACLLIAVASVGVYRRMQYRDIEARDARNSAQLRVDALAAENRTLGEQKTTLDDQLRLQAARLSELESQALQKRQELERVQSELREANAQSKGLAAALISSKADSDQELRTTSQERDSVAARLRDLQQSYESAQSELVKLRAERDRVTLRLASLETENAKLTANNRERDLRLSDQDSRLRDQEQFLASDRDIRDLMGARQLYMADVYDVSSDSRTRKPYGRVFYTQGKSLIFYAFDLDRQPGIKNAAFQAWGRNESSQRVPVNLGILYMDSEQNRRWALHCEDPRQLGEIDAVFVTIEPRGGSAKPTGKPFLYASLRREPNHP
jgi:hypothetical protein